MGFSIKYWIRISVISFLMVAALGLLMRYKIPFTLSIFQQKHLLHSHSHFAFTGWITQTLYVLLTYFILRRKKLEKAGKYMWILVSNLIFSYGMLFSFIWQGYGAVSIAFSTLTIVTNYAFCAWFYKDLITIPAHPSKNWFRASLLFSVISSLGTFYLAYMMYTKSINQHHYLGAQYFFLHFQYNGWFLFASMGLLVAWLKSTLPDFKLKREVFQLFFWACIPAYLLSVLWADMPGWLYGLTVLAAIAQVAGWTIFVVHIKKYWNVFREKVNLPGGTILVLAATAFTIKLILQLGSTIPAVAKLAFGFRPIVIAYLHLILLAVFSLFLLAYAYLRGFLRYNKTTTYGLVIIVTGVFLNEFALLIQGLAGFTYTAVAYINEILLAIAAIIFTGIAVLLVSQYGRDNPHKIQDVR